MEGAVGERKKIKGKEKASASDQTNKVDGTFHVNFEMDIKKTVNIDMPTTLRELKKHIKLAGKEIVGDKGKTNLDSYEFTYSDGRKKHTVNTEQDFREMQESYYSNAKVAPRPPMMKKKDIEDDYGNIL